MVDSSSLRLNLMLEVPDFAHQEALLYELARLGHRDDAAEVMLSPQGGHRVKQPGPVEVRDYGVANDAYARFLKASAASGRPSR